MDDATKLRKPRWLLRCAVCGQVTEVSTENVAGYIDRGWPRCCGEVMTLYTPTTLPPTPDE
jgi:hypothetical protein